MTASLPQILHQLGELLAPRDKLVLAALLLMSVIFAGVETASISLVMPFISLATDPAAALEQASYARIYHFLGFNSTHRFVIAVGGVLIVFYLLRAAYTLVYTYALNRFTWDRYHDLATRLVSTYLALPYREFTQQNSSQLEKSIITEAAYLAQLIVSTLRFIAEAAVAVLLYTVLLFVNLQVTLVVSILLTVKIGALTYLIKRITTRQGVLREQYQSRFYHLLNDAFGNFKLVKLLSTEKQIVRQVSQAASGYCRSNIVNTTVSQLPPTVLETVGLSLLVGIVLYTLLTSMDGHQIIPVISMYALALYRMMPAAHRMLYYYNNMLYYRRSLEIVHKELTRSPPADGDDPVQFTRQVALENVSFNYPGRGSVFEGVSLAIRKNEKIAIIGPSGSGKSTLLDLLIGIHTPDQGKVLVDDVALTASNVRAWRRAIGYIPQNIYLFDGSVAENVAFGKTYDEERINLALKQARIYDFLQLHEGIHTQVGEGGVKFSGGQKQRIGIARALYGDPGILVLDEATSALDPETEAQIMSEIHDLVRDRTLIVVAHRALSTQYFDHIYRVEGGQLCTVTEPSTAEFRATSPAAHLD